MRNGIQQDALVKLTPAREQSPVAWHQVMRSVPQHHTRPVWAEISASYLRANYGALRQVAGAQVEVLAVIKADAYGHSATQCAPVLCAAGAKWLGVTSVEEGIAVRSALASAGQSLTPHLLAMCGIWQGEEAACIEHRLTPVVWEPYHLELLENEAKRRRRPPQSVPVHLEVDTGMARQGVVAGPLLQQLLSRFTPDSPLFLEGVLTHLASSECALDPQNALQMHVFANALQQIRQAGFTSLLVHVGNTSWTDSGLTASELPALSQAWNARVMTRAGLALYGHALPLEGAAARLQPLLHPVMTWKTRVVSLRDVPVGMSVGYNSAYKAPRAMRLALLPVGYADGYRRALSSANDHTGGAVLLHGTRASVVGRVSMDLTIVDVTSIHGVEIGDEAVLLGAQGAEHISANEHAQHAGTSVYEILCGISDRVPRVLLE